MSSTAAVRNTMMQKSAESKRPLRPANEFYMHWADSGSEVDRSETLKIMKQLPEAFRTSYNKIREDSQSSWHYGRRHLRLLTSTTLATFVGSKQMRLSQRHSWSANSSRRERKHVPAVCDTTRMQDLHSHLPLRRPACACTCC